MKSFVGKRVVRCDYCNQAGIENVYIETFIPKGGLGMDELKACEYFDRICPKCKDHYIMARNATGARGYIPPYKTLPRYSQAQFRLWDNEKREQARMRDRLTMKTPIVVEVSDLNGVTKQACERLLATLNLTVNNDLGTVLSVADTRIRRLNAKIKALEDSLVVYHIPAHRHPCFTCGTSGHITRKQKGTGNRFMFECPKCNGAGWQEHG